SLGLRDTIRAAVRPHAAGALGAAALARAPRAMARHGIRRRSACPATRSRAARNHGRRGAGRCRADHAYTALIKRRRLMRPARHGRAERLRTRQRAAEAAFRHATETDYLTRLAA